MIYGLYCILGAFIHILLVVMTPLLKLLVPSWETASRLGRVSDFGRSEQYPLIWIHAASIGEVQAARALIHALKDSRCGCQFFLTTMTPQGRDVARSHLPDDVHCTLAPLDTPQSVGRALSKVKPDMYVCLETELWPVMLTKTVQAGIPMLLLNGRMSESSYRQYQRIRKTVAKLLAGFSEIAVISEEDEAKYRTLGAPESRIRVCGNMKYDLFTGDIRRIVKKYRQLLSIKNESVFVCGSTHSGEEEQLLPVYRHLRDKVDESLIWIIAPRHLERLGEVVRLLDNAGVEFDLLSSCRLCGRRKEIVLVDTMGELADLYSVGDYNFCGGSLVDKGGHNIMEPVRLYKPVYFGPYMKDFQDAVELVQSAGAGFQVNSARELVECLANHMHYPDQYEKACRSAAKLATFQQGAVQRQADMVMELLAA